MADRSLNGLNGVDDAVLRRLFPSGARGHLFALIDGARVRELPDRLQQWEVEHVSLFVGEAGETLRDCGPYLARCDSSSGLVKDWIEEGWGESWGVFLRSSSRLEELKKHFHKLLLVHDEQRTSFLFRFYDPRVLRVFLPTCTPMQVALFFGKVTQFLMEGEDDDEIWVFENQNQRAVCRTIRIDGV